MMMMEKGNVIDTYRYPFEAILLAIRITLDSIIQSHADWLVSISEEKSRQVQRLQTIEALLSLKVKISYEQLRVNNIYKGLFWF